MNFKYAIFDMDGTLLESMNIWENICTDYVRYSGLEVREGFVDKFYTLKPMEGAQLFISEYNLDKTAEQVLKEVNEMVTVKYLNEVVPKNGAEILLKSLKERKVKIALATLTDREIVEMILKKHGLFDYFSVIRTSTEAGKSKKYPDIYNQCTNLLGGTAEETVVFEDSLVAIKTARSAGYFVVGLPDFSNQKCIDEVKANACVFFDSLNDFPVEDYFI
ncbi:MAG: HAD family phosphatase [Clostridia bacterium]|nr:HAD family phosphatase [Clostridia bacterium]